MLLSYATGVVAADSAVFVDFDTLPSTAASLSQTLKFLLAEEARPLRAALVGEVRLVLGRQGVNYPEGISCETRLSTACAANIRFWLCQGRSLIACSMSMNACAPSWYFVPVCVCCVCVLPCPWYPNFEPFDRLVVLRLLLVTLATCREYLSRDVRVLPIDRRCRQMPSGRRYSKSLA